MKVVHLEVAKFPPHRRGDQGWQSFDTTYPTWEEIESAIRRLDRNEWPYICVFTQYSAMGETMWVNGGCGEYRISFRRDEDRRLVDYNDPSRGSERVQICVGEEPWEEDEREVEKRFLCNNLYRVLELVRFFAFTGELSPDASWIEW